MGSGNEAYLGQRLIGSILSVSSTSGPARHMHISYMQTAHLRRPYDENDPYDLQRSRA